MTVSRPDPSLLIGAAVLATVAAVVYGVTQERLARHTGLIFAAAALASWPASTCPSATPTSRRWTRRRPPQSAAARPPPEASLWPLVGALGAVLVVVGIVTYPVVFVFGIIALIAAAVEWMVQAWSERASADAEFNAEVRERIAHPVEFPVLAAVGAGDHRLLVQPDHAVAVEGQRTGAVRHARRARAGRRLPRRLPALRSAIGGIATVGVIAALGLVAGGAAAALERRARSAPARDDPAMLAAEGECDTPDETEADENASQIVGRQGEHRRRDHLRADGTLGRRDARRHRRPATAVVVTRSNPTNMLFGNDSTERARRLVLDLGTAVVDATATRSSDTERSRTSLHGTRRGRRAASS